MRDKSAPVPPLSKKLGKYVVRDLLSKGSMGMVFLAHDPILERDVAIKVMVGSSVRDNQMRERFEREAKAVARLHHPNIVTVHDLGYDPWGSPFIAMELLEGADLDRLVETKALSLGEKLEIIAQVCGGLEHAHGHGLVHRDIKPANIFVTADGTAKIMDFGVARWTQTSQTQGGLVVGTAGYIAPEQLRGRPVDGRCDIFSLGVVLFEVLTHQSLFSGDSIESIFFQTISKDTPVLAMSDGKRLPKLQEIVNRSLAKEASERYATAAEMGKAIRAFLQAHGPLLDEVSAFGVLEPDPAERPIHIADPAAEVPRGETGKAAGGVSSVPPPRPTAQTALPAPLREMSRVGLRSSDRRRPSTSGVGRSSRPSRLPLVAATAVLLVGAVGGALFFSFSSVAPRSSSPESPTGAVLERPVEQEAVGSSEENKATSPEEEGPQSAEPTAREKAAILAADAALALGAGNLEEAGSLIARGEELDPGSSRWARLRDRLRAEEAEAQRRASAEHHVRQAGGFLAAGEYQKAIDQYKTALEYDLENPEARSGLDRAVSLKEQSEAGEARPTEEPPRRFLESETEYVAGGTSEANELLGFEMEEGFEVKETADAVLPAQIVIEIDPPDARPGEPYVLRVTVFNDGYRAIEPRSLEMVSRFGNRTFGKGQQLPLRIGRVAPQATVVLHEISATWQETQNHGEIDATVTLADGSRLTKTVRW